MIVTLALKDLWISMPCFSVQGWREKEVPVNRLPLLIVLGWLIVLRPLAIDLFIVAIFYFFSF
jgi:hypothetical protein